MNMLPAMKSPHLDAGMALIQHTAARVTSLYGIRLFPTQEYSLP